MLTLTCYAHAEGHAIFFDVTRKTRSAFEFTPYLDSRRTRHWTLNILIGAYRPDTAREDLGDREFNLPKLGFLGFERVRAFDVVFDGEVAIRNGLANAVARAYRSAESGVLDTTCSAPDIAEALARFYRHALGHPDRWPSNAPLPGELTLLVGAPAPSRYQHLL